jgi:hypothetical protein
MIDFGISNTLDLNFSGLYDSDFDINCIEELESLLSNQKVSNLHIAYALYLCEKKKLYLKAYPEARMSEIEFKKKYFNERIPILLSLDRRTISDYRIVGKFIDDHYKLLMLYNREFFEGNLLKKLLIAANAVKKGFDIQEIVLNLFTMTKRQFELFAQGQEDNLSAQPKSKLERYVEVHERQRAFFRF